MLARIEQKVAATLGVALATRAHVAVVTAPGSSQAIAAGKGRLVVALQEVLPAAGFREEEFMLAGTEPLVSRRVLTVHFLLLVSARVRPQEETAAAVSQARTLLLDDLSHAAHALAEETFRSGKALLSGDADPGYTVTAFALDGGTVARELADGTVAGELRYRGTAQIWPPGVTSPEGKIEAYTARTGFQPLSFEVKPSRVVAGTPALVIVRGLDAPVRLAVRVMSDLEEAKRGTIASGVAGGVDGKETALRIIEVPEGATEAAIDYTAPAPPLGGMQFELIAIHFATPQNTRGVLLGSAAVRVTEPPPP
jgi:hypothetical protein